MTDGRPKNQPTGDYPVGYSRPPRHSRWKKGRSGNPAGRPKKTQRTRNLRQVRRDFLEVMEWPVTIMLNGQKRTVPGIMAVHARLLQKAAEGDYRSLKLTVELIRALTREHEEAQNILHAAMTDLSNRYDRAAEQSPEKAEEYKQLKKQFIDSPLYREAMRRVFDEDEEPTRRR